MNDPRPGGHEPQEVVGVCIKWYQRRFLSVDRRKRRRRQSTEALCVKNYLPVCHKQHNFQEGRVKRKWLLKAIRKVKRRPQEDEKRGYGKRAQGDPREARQVDVENAARSARKLEV
jgi:hypothetical protein